MNQPLYKSLAHQTVIIVDNLVTIPSLCTGGVIDRNTNDAISLDSGYLIQISNTTSLLNLKIYSQKIRPNAAQTWLLAAKIDNRLNAIEQLICKNAEQWMKLQLCIIWNFPEESSSLVFDDPS